MNDFALAPIINNSSISSKKDYIIIKKIGQGATATVYKVKCVHDNLIYAMKVIPIDQLALHKQHLILREALILKQIQHPNIIKFYGAFIEQSQLFIITEYAEQGDINSIIEQQKQKKKHFSEKEIWRLFWDLSLAVLHLHSHNILHRDIKSLNIFITENSTLKVNYL